MAVTVTGTPATYGSASSSTATISKQAGLADGDVLIAFVQQRSNVAGATWTLPSGWTQIAVNAVNHQWIIAYKAIPSVATESATSYDFIVSSAVSRMAGTIVAFRGVLSSGPIDAVGAIGGQAGTTVAVLPAVTAASASALLVSFAAYVQQTSASVSAWTPDAVMTEVVEVTGGTAGTAASVGIQVATQQLAAAGATGTRTQTVAPTTTNTGGVMFTLAPAGGTPTATPPTANAGADVAGIEPYTTATLTGTDVAGTNPITARSWSQVSGTAVALTGTGATRTYATPGTLLGAALTFRYAVTASDGTVTDDIIHTVLQVNERAIIGGVQVPIQVRAT